MHEARRRQMEAKIYEEDLRVFTVKQSQKDLLFKRNVRAPRARVRCCWPFLCVSFRLVRGAGARGEKQVARVIVRS